MTLYYCVMSLPLGGETIGQSGGSSGGDSENKPYPLELLVKVLNEERLLCTIKLITDWLRGNSDVITTTAEVRVQNAIFFWPSTFFEPGHF